MKNNNEKKLLFSKKAIIASVFVIVVITCASIWGLKSNASKAPAELDITDYETGLEPMSSAELAWFNENAVEIDNVEEYYDYVNDEKTSNSEEITGSGSTSSTDEDTPESTYNFPAQVDNSTSKYFPPIGDQGSLGSCCSWANTYYQMSYMYNRAYDRDSSKEANLFSPMWTYEACGGNEAAISQTLIEMGAATLTKIPAQTEYENGEERLYRYFANDSIWKEALNYRLDSIYKITIPSGCTITNNNSESLDEIKVALSNGEILTFTTDVYKWRFSTINYSSDNSNYNDTTNEKYKTQSIVARCDCTGGGLHRMTIVGYDDNIWYDINENGVKEDGEIGAFKIANSWGTHFGNDGFVWLSYDALNSVSSVRENSNVDLTTKRAAALGDIVGYKVKETPTDLYAEFTLNSCNRGELNIDIIAQNDTATYKYDVLRFSASGSKMGFDGTDTASDGKFAIALDNVKNDISQEDLNDLEWKIHIEDVDANDTNVTVKDVDIVDNSNNTVYTQNNEGIFTVDSSYKNAVVSTLNDNDTLTIYYTGYSTPYIQYQIDGMNWGPGHGYAMEATDEVSGYTHKFTINLGTSSFAKACFNDGNENWDSNKGLNYKFESGVYTYNAGTITKLSDCTIPFKADLKANEYDVALTSNPITLCASTVGFDGTVSYRFGYILNDKETFINDFSSTSEINWTPKEGGSYTLFVDAKDTSGNSTRKCLYDYTICELRIADIITDLNAPQRAGTSIKLNAKVLYAVTTDTQGVTCKYEAILNGVSTVIPTQADNTAIWTPTQKGTYTLRVTATDAAGQVATIEEGYKIKDQDPSLKIEDIAINSSEGVIIKDAYTQAFIDVDGGSGDFTISFGYIDQNGQDVTCYTNVSSQYMSFPTPYTGDITYFATATDSTGTTVRFEKTYTVQGCKITKVNITPEDYGYVGENVTIGVDTQYEINYKNANSRTYVFTNNETGASETITGFLTYGSTVSWMPKKAGTYTIDITVSSYSTALATTSIQYEVKPSNIPVEENNVTIYYKGYSTPYIHYQVGDGAWTTAPGVAMTATSEVAGYTHKAVINLGYDVTTTVCFNDGNGNWDSNNGSNYVFSRGTYAYSDGTTRQVDEDNNIIDVHNITTIYYKGFSNPYIHYQIGSGEWTTAPGVAMTATSELSGYTHKIEIDLGQSTSLTACFNDGNGNWDSNYGNNYSFGVGSYSCSGGVVSRNE